MTMHGCIGLPAPAEAQTVAILLAGGRGQRLEDLTDGDAKPGLPFGAKFRLIDFPLSNCINSGIRRIGIATQYCAHTLIQHVHRTWGTLRAELNEFVEVWPAQQEAQDSKWYAGTADAVHRNRARLKTLRPRYVLILAGDHVYKQDYRKLLSDHIRKGADVTVSCVDVPAADSNRFGILLTDACGRVTRFIEKPSTPPVEPTEQHCLASMGVYVFNADVLYQAVATDHRRPGSAHDFGQDIIPKLVKTARVFAHRFSESVVGGVRERAYWRDVGTVDAYWEAHMDIVQDDSPIALWDRTWPVWTIQDHAPPVRIYDSGATRSVISNALFAGGCTVSGATIRHSVLFEGTEARNTALISECVILPRCYISPRARLSKTVLAEGCVIPPDLEIGFNPEADRARFFRSAGGIVLVTPAMLQRITCTSESRRPRRQVAFKTHHLPGLRTLDKGGRGKSPPLIVDASAEERPPSGRITGAAS